MDKENDLRKERGNQTRQRIIDAAFSLMIDEGPQSLTAGQITKKANVSKAILFHHFEDVDDVAFSTLKSIFARFSTASIEASHKSVSEFIYKIGAGVIDAPFSKRTISAAFLYFYERAAHDKKFRLLLEKALESLVGHVRSSLIQILKRPLQKQEQTALPLLITMCLEGLGKLCIVTEDRSDLKTAWRYFSKMIGERFEGSPQ